MDTNIESIIFTKPKKHGDYFISKVKDELIIQFPKMTVNSVSPKNMELEFINQNSKYCREVYDFLSKIDEHVMYYVSENIEEWFGKKIPTENIKQMFNKFIKSPKTSESQCTLSFTINPKSETILFDNKKNEIKLSELVSGNTVECISQMKYIVFSKDTCFVTWELQSAKLYIKKEKVAKYGFIEVPEDLQVESESDEDELISFF